MKDAVPQIAMGQVNAVYPDEYAVEVLFPNLAMLTGVRVPLTGSDVDARSGAFSLPERGNWGLVAFYQNDWRSARWLGTLTDAFTHSIPLEALSQDPDLRARFDRSGRESYRHGAGDLEVQHPDGSLFRITHGPGAFDKRTDRYVGEKTEDGEGRRVRYRKADKKRIQVYFEQQERTRFHLDDEGNAELSLSYPGGTRALRYRLQLRNDGTVRVENQPGSTVTLASDGSVTIENSTAGVSQASIRLTVNGDIVLTPGPAGRVLLGGDAAALPVARVGDQAPGVILPNSNLKVYTV